MLLIKKYKSQSPPGDFSSMFCVLTQLHEIIFNYLLNTLNIILSQKS